MSPDLEALRTSFDPQCPPEEVTAVCTTWPYLAPDFLSPQHAENQRENKHKVKKKSGTFGREFLGWMFFWGAWSPSGIAWKSVIAREFLLKIDTLLAIATSGLRTHLLFETPPSKNPPLDFPKPWTKRTKILWETFDEEFAEKFAGNF